MTDKSNSNVAEYFKSISRVAYFNRLFFLNSGFDFTNTDHKLPEEIITRLVSISKRFNKNLESIKYDIWKIVNKMREEQTKDEEFEIDSLQENEYGEPLDEPEDDV